MNLEVITLQPTSYDVQRPPLLFIHGGWHGAWCWEPNFFPYFVAQGFEVYALSLRGHGKSSDGQSLQEASFMDYVSDVARTVAALPRKPILIGHSLGGAVVMKYLEDASTPAAILLAPVPPGGTRNMKTAFEMRHYWIIRLIFLVGWRPFRRHLGIVQDAFFSKDLPINLIRHYANKLQHESRKAMVYVTSSKLIDTTRIKTPIVVFGAEQDQLISLSVIHETAQALNAKVIIIPDIAHDMMLDTQWRNVADAIYNWIDEEGL